MENSDKIKWWQNLGQNLIQSVETKIGDEIADKQICCRLCHKVFSLKFDEESKDELVVAGRNLDGKTDDLSLCRECEMINGKYIKG